MLRQVFIVMSAGCSMFVCGTNAFAHSMALPHSHDGLLFVGNTHWVVALSALAVVGVSIAYSVRRIMKFKGNQ